MSGSCRRRTQKAVVHLSKGPLECERSVEKVPNWWWAVYVLVAFDVANMEVPHRSPQRFDHSLTEVSPFRLRTTCLASTFRKFCWTQRSFEVVHVTHTPIELVECE